MKSRKFIEKLIINGRRVPVPPKESLRLRHYVRESGHPNFENRFQQIKSCPDTFRTAFFIVFSTG